jgi:hypothetical protein
MDVSARAGTPRFPLPGFGTAVSLGRDGLGRIDFYGGPSRDGVDGRDFGPADLDLLWLMSEWLGQGTLIIDGSGNVSRERGQHDVFGNNPDFAKLCAYLGA